jgi:Sporulation factor SpoIIGA.
MRQQEVGQKNVTITLYLAGFFLINFGMDYLLLSLVKRLLHLASPWQRLSAASLAGAIWACLDLLVGGIPAWAEFLLTWVVVGGIMAILAFGKGRCLCQQSGKRKFSDFHDIGISLLTFWMVSALAGGIFSVLGDQTLAGWYLSGTRAVRQWRLLPLCFWAAGIYFGLCGCLGLIRKKTKEQRILYQVKLSYRGEEVLVTALWDTGNQLYDPYGGQPVHIVTGEVCRRLCKSVPQLIYIPFRTVGNEYGMMPGIRIDFMEAEEEGKVVRRWERPWLAVSKRPLSLSHQYEMLLHGEE